MADFLIVCSIILAVVCVSGKIFLEYRKKVNKLKKEFYKEKDVIDQILSSFFSGKYGDYTIEYPRLCKQIHKMQNINKTLTFMSRKNSCTHEVKHYLYLVSAFDELGKNVAQLTETYMIDPLKYGGIQKNFWNAVSSLSKNEADSYLQSIETKSYCGIVAVDIRKLICCAWFYAIEKPYSAESFKKVVSIFDVIRKDKDTNMDIIIAELYAMKQMGGEDALHDRIRKILEDDHFYEKFKGGKHLHLELLASALMWMKAYRSELCVLQYMLNNRIQMSKKGQERLHSLSNGGGKISNDLDILSEDNYIHFDISALSWKDDEYIALFENLAFKEKTLLYSLAVRDENKELTITKKTNVPSIDELSKKLKAILPEEYEGGVIATQRDCIAHSSSEKELVRCILLQSNECRHMGILVHVACIGKKFNIKFYTLFIPNNSHLEVQKHQALSLYKKLSPTVTMWESSIKDTVLRTIQQFLNFRAPISSEDNYTPKTDAPIF